MYSLTIFDDATREGLVNRIAALTPGDQARWGKMSVSQMVEHCIRWEEIMNGKTKAKRVFIGILFGKMALKSMIGNDKPIKRGMPTLKELIIRESDGDFETQKLRWIALVNSYKSNTSQDFQHPFCGNMTRDETGRLACKHTDHHLKQFGR